MSSRPYSTSAIDCCGRYIGLYTKCHLPSHWEANGSSDCLLRGLHGYFSCRPTVVTTVAATALKKWASECTPGVVMALLGVEVRGCCPWNFFWKYTGPYLCHLVHLGVEIRILNRDVGLQLFNFDLGRSIRYQVVKSGMENRRFSTWLIKVIRNLGLIYRSCRKPVVFAAHEWKYQFFKL